MIVDGIMMVCNVHRIMCLFLLLWFAVSPVTSTENRYLNDYIRHYEELDYSSHELHQSHQRAKRSIHNPVTELKLSTHGKYFHLKMTHDTSVFSQDFKLEDSNNATQDIDTSFLVKGTVNDDPQSVIHGAILDGVFSGQFGSPALGEWHVEPAAKYFNDEKPLKFHSVIYNVENMNMDPYRHIHAHRSKGMCGHETLDPWMNAMMNFDIKGDFNHHHLGQRRGKRQANAVIPVKNICTLYLLADQELYKYMNRQYKDDLKTKMATLAMFGTHVSVLNDIFSNTVFDNQEKGIAYTGIGFRVLRVKINTTADCEGQKGNTNPFCATNIDVRNFLNLNSLMNHNEYCLAYLFTYRDFTEGTLGLAWVGSAPNIGAVASGGICEQWKQYTDSSATNRRVYKSLNTGVATLVNYGKTVPPKVSSLSFTHDIGHSFGAVHDSGPCAPSDNGGNFIMSLSTITGNQGNNFKFSSCSRNNISLVLNSVFTEKHGKRNCFIAQPNSFCGNGIREEGEECDCGFKEDCTDKCCNPKGTSNECKLKSNEHGHCSPSQGPCCNPTTCSYLSSTTSCRDGEEDIKSCHLPSVCDGSSAQCPAPPLKPDGAECSVLYIQGKCQNGSCINLCKTIGMEVCSFIAGDAQNACYLACKACQGKDCTCYSSKDVSDTEVPAAFKTLVMNVNGGQGIQLQPGAPCNGYQGHCDMFHKCRKINDDGPLKRLLITTEPPEEPPTTRSPVSDANNLKMTLYLTIIMVFASLVWCNTALYPAGV